MKQLWAFIKVNLKDALQYRGDILLFTISNVSNPIISLIVWSTISHGSGNSLPMSQNQIFSYFTILMFVNLVTSTWGGWFVSQDIRLGNISKLLLKPTSVLYEQLGNNISEKIFKLIYLIPVIIIVSYIYPFNVNVSLIPLFALSLSIAALMGFLVDLIITASAFWLDDNGAVFQLFDIPMLFLSGIIIPLAVMPELVRNLTYYLPYRYFISFPIEILTGTLSSQEMGIGFVIQLIWFSIIVVGYKLSWKAGFRVYSASGA